MTCDGLPDPGSLSDMNTFLFLWSLKDQETSMATMEEKCRVITQVSNDPYAGKYTRLRLRRVSAVEQAREDHSVFHHRYAGLRG